MKTSDMNVAIEGHYMIAELARLLIVSGSKMDGTHLSGSINHLVDFATFPFSVDSIGFRYTTERVRGFHVLLISELVKLFLTHRDTTEKFDFSVTLRQIFSASQLTASSCELERQDAEECRITCNNFVSYDVVLDGLGNLFCCLLLNSISINDSNILNILPGLENHFTEFFIDIATNSCQSTRIPSTRIMRHVLSAMRMTDVNIVKQILLSKRGSAKLLKRLKSAKGK